MKGILFSDPMVRAIRDGRKTQTRRLHPKPRYALGEIVYVKEVWTTTDYNNLCRPSDGEIVYRADDQPWADEYEHWRWKSSLHLSEANSRIKLRIVETRAERLWDISEADALAEGLDRETCAEIFDKAAGKHTTYERHWLESEDGDSSFSDDYCLACAERELTKERKTDPSVGLCGDCGSAGETDGPAFCCSCGEALLVSLTEYGIEGELLIEDDRPENRERFPVSGVDARIIHTIADGIGDLQDKHLGRLAQIGFATAWDLLHGRGAWAKNPKPWVYTFEKV
jgi:hypothetical protein